MSELSPFGNSPRPASAEVLAAKELQYGGAAVWVGIGHPVQFPQRAGWRCRVRVERGTRLEQSQVVAASEREVLRMALELVAGRLGMTETQFLDGAAIDARASEDLLAATR